MGLQPRANCRQELPQHRRWQHIQPFDERLGTDLQRRDPQQTFTSQEILSFGDRRHPPPHQAHRDSDDDGQRQEPLAHTDEPFGLPGIAPLQLARGQQRRTEHVQQPLFHVFHRRQGDLRAVPKLRMGPVSRLFVCHGVPPLVRRSIIAQSTSYSLS